MTTYQMLNLTKKKTFYPHYLSQGGDVLTCIYMFVGLYASNITHKVTDRSGLNFQAWCKEEVIRFW